MTRSGGSDLQLPKYAQIERERRWLVDRPSRPDLGGLPFTLIEDSYLCGTRLRLRRMTDSMSQAVMLKLTKKYEAVDPLARPIVTAYLTEAEYDVFSALPSCKLIKRRFKLSHSADVFSLDQFDGALSGLELLEIESDSSDGLKAVEPPHWIAMEVSEDSAFQGGSLAQCAAAKLDELLRLTSARS